MLWNTSMRCIALLICVSIGWARLAAADLPPTIVTSAAAAPATIVGKTTQLTVTGADDGGAAALTYSWTATGPANVTVSPNGTNAAKTATATFTTPGTYTITAKIADQLNQFVTSAVTVTVVSTPTSMDTMSTGTGILNPGQTKTYTGQTYNQFGTIVTTPGPVTWTMDSGGGSINASGVYTAALPVGFAFVRGTCGSLTNTARVQVNAVPTVASPVSSASTTITAKTAAFDVQGADDQSVDLLNYTWTATGPGSVSFSPANSLDAEHTVATFTAPGTYTITARIADKQSVFVTSALNVTVVSTPSAMDTISTGTGILNPGQTKTYTGVVYNQFGTIVAAPGPVTWSMASGPGSINASGVYTAALPTGFAFVRGTCGALTNTARVQVNAPPTIAQAVHTDGSPLRVATPLALGVLGADDTNEVNLTYTWSITSGVTNGVTFSANGTNAAKNTTITVSQTGSYTVQALIRDPQGLTVTSTITLIGIAAQATPTITWATPPAITYGVLLSATQLNAASPVAGSFTYVPALGTKPNAGTQTLTATFTPTDSVTYTTATAIVQLVIQPATPVLSWPVPPVATWGTVLSATQLNAASVAGIPGTFVYTPGVGTTPEVGTQTLSVVFTPTDGINYTTVSKSVSLTVTQAPTAVTWAAPAPISWGTALSAVQQSASGSVLGTMTYTPAPGTVLEVGQQLLSVVFQPTDAVHYANSTATVPLLVQPVTPALTWVPPAPISYGTDLSPVQLQASSPVAGTITYDPPMGTMMDVGPNLLTATLTPTDTAHYAPTSTSVILLVQAAQPLIGWAQPNGIIWGTALSSAQLHAVAGVNGTYAYTPDFGSVPEVGAQSLSVIFTPTDLVHYAPATASVTLLVDRVTPIVTWATPGSVPAGTALSGAQLNASTGVQGTFAYTPGLGTVVSQGSQVLQASFTPTDAAHYQSVTAAVLLTVTPAVPVVGVTTTYIYDSANRLSERRYSGGVNGDRFEYDHVGRLTKARSDRYNNTVNRAYDAANRLTSESLTIEGDTLTVGTEYDNANRMTKQTYPDGSKVERDYTARGELFHVWDGGKVVAARFYDNGGRLTQTQYGNGLTESRGYGVGDNLVATIKVPGVTDFTYTYDANRRKTAEIDGITATNTQHFGYDDADRVKTWKRTAGALGAVQTQQAWDLSPVGDWNSTTVDGQTQDRTHTAVHEIATIGNTTLTSDFKGNLTRDDQGQEYTWDVENRLVTAVNLKQGHGDAAAYAYDALGRRVKKAVTTHVPAAGEVPAHDVVEKTYFISAGAQEVVEITGDLSAFNDPAADPESSGAAPFDPLTGKGARGSLLTDPDAQRVNFQPASTDTPDGWGKDLGQIPSDVTAPGWITAVDPIDRDHLGRPLYDSFAPIGSSTWSIPIENGTHAVVLMCGDADSRAQTNNLLVNGVPVRDPTPYDGQALHGYETGAFDGYAITVTVTDGHLTILGDADALNPKINFIEIGATGSSVDQATSDRVAAAADQATKDTAKPKAKTPPLVRRNVFLSYVDDLASYSVAKPRHAARKFFVSSNHLFSAAAVTNANGQVVSRYVYNTYGKQSVSNIAAAAINLVGLERGFTGYRYDGETALDYARARMYSSTLGRFVSRDPVSAPYFATTSMVYDVYPKAKIGKSVEQVTQLYQYALGNPAMHKDPYGLFVAVEPVLMSDPTAGNCGNFSMLWQFFLSEPAPMDGNIIQYLSIEIYKYDCKDKLIDKVALRIYEAFPISRGQRMGGLDRWFYNNGEGCSKGSFSILGTAGFYGGDLPPDFKVDNDGDPSVKTGPSVPAEGRRGILTPVSGDSFRYAIGSWNCCSDECCKKNGAGTPSPTHLSVGP